MGLFGSNRHRQSSSSPTLKCDHLGYPVGLSRPVQGSQGQHSPKTRSKNQTHQQAGHPASPPTNPSYAVQPPPYQEPRPYGPIIVNQHYYLTPGPSYAAPSTCSSNPLGLHNLGSSMVDLASKVMPREVVHQVIDDGLPRWHCPASQLLNQSAALYDQIQTKFNEVMTSIDCERFSGHEGDLFHYQPAPAQAPATVPDKGRTKKVSKKDNPKGQTTAVVTSLASGGYFAKVDLYANSRLPDDLPPLRLYIPTWPLICLAAQYSERVYEKSRGTERDAYVDADWRTGTKAMCIKSVPMDHMHTIVFAIRGTATFMDWAVNLNTAPTAPTGFLDDVSNFCHAGFLSAARKMIKPVASRLRQLLEENPDRSSYSLLITGHSAGGAVASLLYSHMLAKTKAASSELNTLTGCFKRVHCITFGTPPVSRVPLRTPDRFELRKSLFLSFINEGDPVARADKAYVRSLLELFTSPVPSQADNVSSPPSSPPTKLGKTKDKKPKTGPTTKKSKATLRPTQAPTQPPKVAKPVWKLPSSSLSNAGRIVILRSGDAKANKTKGRKTVEERLNEGVLAQVATDEQLRNVVWGDPVCHVMRLYAGRIETLAVGAYGPHTSEANYIRDGMCLFSLQGKESAMRWETALLHILLKVKFRMCLRTVPEEAGTGKKHIENLESRLATIEDDLRRSGLPKDKTLSEEASPQNEEASTNSPRDETNSPRSDRRSSQDAAPPPVKRIFPGMDLGYWRGIAARRRAIRANTRFDKFQQQVFAPLFTGEPNRVFIGHVFDEIMAPFPFLDWASVDAKLKGSHSCHDPAWRACEYAIISITACFRAANTAFEEIQGDAWAYFKTAFALFPQLMAQFTDLGAVEAIVAMAMFLRGSPDAQNLSFLVSSASHLYHMINLRNSRPSSLARDAPESQQQTRLLLALYSMDQELVFKHGLSSTLDIPWKIPRDLESQEILNMPMAELFRKRTSLAMVQSHINEALYSSKRPDLENNQLVLEIHRLRGILQEWGSEMHLVVPPAANESAINELETSILIHVNDLYLAHYSTILMLYWPARQIPDTEGSESYGSTQFVGAVSTSKCADAAQETLLLLGHFYSLPFMSLWSFLSYFVSAHITLFSITLARPSGPAASGYLWAMEVFVGCLELIIKENGFDISKIVTACSAMTFITRGVVKPAGTDCSSENRDQAQAALDLLDQATSPMYIAQNWMSNMKNKDYDTSVALARVLEIPWDLAQRYGPLVPESLMPETYAFGFEESKDHAMYSGP